MVDDLHTKPDRDRVAALIAAADRLATPLDFEIIDRRPIRRGGVIAAIVVAAVLVGLIGATALGGGGDATADDRVATTVEPLPAVPRSDIAPIAASAGPSAAAAAGDATAVDTTASPSTSPTTGATASPTTSPTTGATASPTTAATASPTAGAVSAAPDPGVATNPDTVPVRYAIYSGGKVYLRGPVPDRATAATIREKISAVLGADNVVDEYVIDPSAPAPRSAPLYVADGLLFDPDSDELGAAGRGLVDIGIALLQQNPGVTWIIEGHTDNLGSDAYNIELSQRRLDAIVSYIADHGIDPRRVTTVAKGESEPIADNATRAGRAQNRRIEIIIEGLLD
jgi:outer membrane protein OmpA-like peptidoglycan-associated protein